MVTFGKLAIGAALISGLVAATPSVFAEKAPTGKRVVITFKASAERDGRDELARAGGKILVDLAEVHAVATTLPKAVIQRLAKSPNVVAIEDDGIRYPSGAVTTPSTSPYQPGQTEPYGIRMVQADLLSDASASNRKVCIIDSGYQTSHEDLTGNNVTGEQMTTSGEWYTDEVHHGTHVGGTISAIDQANIGVMGVLPHGQIQLHIIKVFPGRASPEGAQFDSVIELAMLHCRRAGANVVSMSLGGPGSSTHGARVAKALAASNVLAIAAAGNAGDTSVSFPAGYPEVVSVAAIDVDKAHAAFSQVNEDVEISAPGVQVLSTVPMGTGRSTSLTVGRSSFDALPTDGPVGTASAPLYNFGTGEVDDPGVAGKMCLIQRGNISFADKVTRCQNNGGVGAVIYNNQSGVISATLGGAPVTIPSATVTQADGATLVGMVGQTANLAITASNYAFFNGTSMATPHVSAVAALVWSYYPNCTAAQIRSTLNNSAQDLGEPGRDPVFGYGLVQAKAAYDRIKSLGCGN